MKAKVFYDNTAQSILEKERELTFMESPITDWVFEKTEDAPDVTVIPDRDENTENDSEFDPSENENQVIYGPPEEMGIGGFDDWL